MKRKKEQVLKKKQWVGNKRLIVTLIVLVGIVVLGFLLSIFLLQTRKVKFSLEAAIIDQLEKEFPNPWFVGNATHILETAGFNVTYHGSNAANVSFFKGLAEYNYGIIILRVHSALRADNSTVDLFTAEPFREHAYVQDLDKGLLVKGILNYSQGQKEYFAFSPEFIGSLKGTFPKSIVIAMGCWSLKPDRRQMAEAFIKKSAEAYIGWTGLVGSNHTDNETIKLLRMLFEEDEKISTAVRRTTPDLTFGSEMKYYPTTAGNLGISDLIAEVNTSTSRQSVITWFKFVFSMCVTSFMSVEIKRNQILLALLAYQIVVSLGKRRE